MNYIVPNWIAFVILLLGGINWGLVGIFNFNLVEWIFGGYNAGSMIIYILVLLAAIWLIIAACMQGAIYLMNKKTKNNE